MPQRPLDPADSSQPQYGMGHNEPPIADQIKAQMDEHLTEDRPDFYLRYQEALETPKRIQEIKTKKQLGDAGDFIRLGKAIIQHIGDAKRAVKQPHADRASACDARHNELVDPMQDALDEVQQKMNEFVAADEQRAREKEEKRNADLARQREAEKAEEKTEASRPSPAEDESSSPTPPPARKPGIVAAAPVRRNRKVRSDAGTTVSTQDARIAEIYDYAAAFPQVMNDPRVREAMQNAIQKQVNAGVPQIPGVTITEAKKAVAR